MPPHVDIGADKLNAKEKLEAQLKEARVIKEAHPIVAVAITITLVCALVPWGDTEKAVRLVEDDI